MNDCKFIELAHTVAQIINMAYIIKWEKMREGGRCAEINFKWLSMTVLTVNSQMTKPVDKSNAQQKDY